MKIFIIVPLDFKFSTLSTVGQQFEKSEDKLKEFFDRQTHYVIQRLVGAML